MSDPWGMSGLDARAAPPVLGVEPDDAELEAEAERSRVVLLPCREPIADGAQTARVEVRSATDGRPTLPIYSSTETLVACCGEHQPWIAVRFGDVGGLAEQAGAQVIVEDVELPEEHRHMGEETA